ncbi:NADH dehydrogenase [ubiquinone] 1 beta subcomplex subunit 7-like [Arachis stenosperma]|uniref:NADH dehydrogenase [ubiquinone] 1 beta subcomplex subunit 7-like n=1 Tax=Arachis stenosperma TaxID=217475 RepID=UPI0025AD762D|nr:NADH dehydrogenase [ubiquinone] 1 beta subcomplex subunit 7-like [Arachis stenosperma]
MEVLGSSQKMIATQEKMVEAKVPLAYRDQCAHLLIPLNKCHQADLYLPWKCENERHSYEKCQYELLIERMLQMQKIKERASLNHSQSKGAAFPVIPKTANA